MPRFVLLRHECPPEYEKPSHWDFMLEWQEVLRTWELRELPQAWAQSLGESFQRSTVEAIALPDHRLDYLDYEGPVSGDRGTVCCCDRGSYELLQSDANTIKVRLEGERLKNLVQLKRPGSDWLLAPA